MENQADSNRRVRQLLRAARRISRECAALSFASPVAYVYNPLEYAWDVHAAYIQAYGGNRKKVLFLGMNPGPFGMAQTGIPFGEVELVRDWLSLEGRVRQPPKEHPKRPIQGFACTRSEVSGRRLWGLFKARFKRPEKFFRDHFVVNFCPLVFMEAGGRNLTPDRLPQAERAPLLEVCRQHLAEVIRILEAPAIVGVGKFAEKEALRVIETAALSERRVHPMLHPSPASPAANQDWAGKATTQMKEQGLWR